MTAQDDIKRARELDRRFAAWFCDAEHYTPEQREAMVKERELIRLRSNV